MREHDFEEDSPAWSYSSHDQRGGPKLPSPPPRGLRPARPKLPAGLSPYGGKACGRPLSLPRPGRQPQQGSGAVAPLTIQG
jgi:hypothetical protein